VANNQVTLDGSFRTIPTELQEAGGDFMNCVRDLKWSHSWEHGALRTRHELIRDGHAYEMVSTRTVTQPNIMRVRSEIRSHRTGLVVVWGEREYLRVREAASPNGTASTLKSATIKLEHDTSLHTTLVKSVSPARSGTPDRSPPERGPCSRIKTREQIASESSERRKSWKKAHETAPNLLLAGVMTSSLPVGFRAPSCRSSP